MLRVKTIHEPIKGDFAKRLTKDVDAMFSRMRKQEKPTPSNTHKLTAFSF